MAPITLVKLNTIYKELRKQTTFLTVDIYKQFEIIVDIFKYIFANVDSKYVPEYFNEYCIKVATVLEICETLEFGRIRSNFMRLRHESYISPDKDGGFEFRYDHEKGLRLSLCSHEGLNTLFKKLEKSTVVDVDAVTFDVLSNSIDLLGGELERFRKNVVSVAKDTFYSYLSASKGRIYKMKPQDDSGGGFQLNNFYDFKCSYYCKDLKSGNAVTTIKLFSEMVDAERSSRNLLQELRDATILSPSGFSHESILSMRLNDMETTARVEEQMKNQAMIVAEEKQKLRVINKKAKAERDSARLLLSEGDRKQLAESISEGKRLAYQAIDAKASCSSSDSEASNCSINPDIECVLQSTNTEDVSVHKFAVKTRKDHSTRESDKHSRNVDSTVDSSASIEASHETNIKPKSSASAAKKKAHSTRESDKHSRNVDSTVDSSASIEASDVTKVRSSKKRRRRNSRDSSSSSNSIKSCLDGVAASSSRLNDIDDELLPSNDEEWSDSDDGSNLAVIARKVSSTQNSGDIDNFVEHDSVSDKAAIKRQKLLEKQTLRKERLLNTKLCRQEKLADKRRALCDAYLMVSEDSDEDGHSNQKRKQKIGSGFNESMVEVYKDDYKLSKLNKDIVVGVADSILSGSLPDSNDIDGDSLKESLLRDFRTKLNESCDREMKGAVMKYLQVEIFKEVTFERLIVAFCVAKRQAVGARDDEIIDIDWFEVLSEFSVNIKDRLYKNNESIMDRIYALIDESSKFKLSEKAQVKKQYLTSMLAFRKHCVRVINKVVNRTISKISCHWEALNFAKQGLPSSQEYAHKSRGALFAFSAGSFDVLTGSSIDTALVGVDAFVSEICRSNNKDGHMDTLIKYEVVARSKYQGYYNKPPPNNASALSTIAANMSTIAADNIIDTDISVEGSTKNYSEVMSPDSVIAFSNDNVVAFSNDNEISQDALIMNKFVTPAKTSAVHFNVDDSFDVDFPARDNEVATCPANYNTNMALGDFLKTVFTGVSGHTSDLCLQLCYLNGPKRKELIPFLKFLDENRDSTAELLFRNFCATPSFADHITCRFLIPFCNEDRLNIVPDGYCYYRSTFQLYMNSLRSFSMTAEEMKNCDVKISMTEGGDDRAAFHEFFYKLEQLLPECYGKSKVMNAQITFFNLKSPLDVAFWGCLDSVAYLDFPCSGFSYLKDESLPPGHWANYRCSSIFGLEDGRQTIDDEVVGHSPSLKAVSRVLSYKPNFVIHRVNHFFVSDRCSGESLRDSYEECVKQILVELQRRVKVSKNCDSSTEISFMSIIQRCFENANNNDDVFAVRAALKVLNEDLCQRHIKVMAETNPPQPKTLKRTACSLYSTNNLDESYALLEQSFCQKESELESLKEELEALKRMIIRNAIAKENPVQLLDGTDESEEISCQETKSRSYESDNFLASVSGLKSGHHIVTPTFREYKCNSVPESLMYRRSERISESYSCEVELVDNCELNTIEVAEDQKSFSSVNNYMMDSRATITLDEALVISDDKLFHVIFVDESLCLDTQLALSLESVSKT